MTSASALDRLWEELASSTMHSPVSPAGVTPGSGSRVQGPVAVPLGPATTPIVAPGTPAPETPGEATFDTEMLGEGDVAGASAS